VAELVIFGAADVARLAHTYFARDSTHRVVAFTVDRAFVSSDRFLDLPLIAFEQVADEYPPDRYEMFVAIGYAQMNGIRAERYAAAKRAGYRLASYVSSRCTWLADEPAGENAFILEDNTIQPFVRIGNNVTLWSGNHIGHDSVIGDHCFITSHVVVSGRVTVGERCFIGVNATIRDAVSIAPQTLIGAGAVILKNTVERGVYVGERVKRLPKTSDQIDL
jgi:sugar O-acyltransferase (sialic acid O-acetyltransferase NeuD family)